MSLSGLKSVFFQRPRILWLVLGAMLLVSVLPLALYHRQVLQLSQGKLTDTESVQQTEVTRSVAEEIQQFDANLSKNFALYNRMKLQIRMEAFNVLNHPLWSEAPDGSTNDSTFGLIQRGPTGQSNLPRQLQLSAKIVW